MPTHGPSPPRPPDAAGRARLERVVGRFEEAWTRAGTRPSIDDYLGLEPGLRSELLPELVHAELEFRLDRGEAAGVEEYLGRYPELAADRRAVPELIATE